MAWMRYRLGRLIIPLVTALGLLAAVAPSASAQGGIKAYCNGNTPVIKSRPPGTEYITVRCENGLVRFVVTPQTPPAYNPLSQRVPQAIPPDFGGWVTVWLNGRPLKTPFDPARGIQEPGAYLSRSTSRVMMPVRFFTMAFGGTVEWSQAKHRARLFLNGKLLQVWVGESQASVNDQFITLDQPAVLFQDRVFVPVRFLMEGFGGKVQWDQFNRSARVQLNGQSCVSPVYCGEAR